MRQFHRPMRRGERGSALVLATMIMLAMLGLGLLAMRSSTQNIAGAGNSRLSMQAKYVAELGLYHAVTLMSQEGDTFLRERSASPRSSFELLSDGRVRTLAEDGSVLATANRTAPDLLTQALGDYAGTPSYRVQIEGFTRSKPRSGFGIGEESQSGELFCLMHFTAQGYIADTALPTQADLDDAAGRGRFAEHRIKAGVVLGPFQSDCDMVAAAAAPGP